MDAATNGKAQAAEMRGPYIDAPVWPWTVAGWTLAAIAVLLFLAAWTYRTT